MQPIHILAVTLLLSLALPVTAEALSKNEVRERSLKRLDRVGETIRSEGRQEEQGGPRFGWPPQDLEDDSREAASPAPQGQGHVPPGKDGRARERQRDEAVILVPAPAGKAAPGPGSPSATAPSPARPTPAAAAKTAAAPPALPGPPAAPAAAKSAPSPAQKEKALVLFRQALAAADRNDHQKALELLDKATSLDPTDPDFFNNRGNTLNNLGNPRKALEDYSTAISLKPNDPAYLCNRGVVHESLGDDAAACRDYRAACDLGDCGFFNSFKKEGRCP